MMKVQITFPLESYWYADDLIAIAMLLDADSEIEIEYASQGLHHAILEFLSQFEIDEKDRQILMQAKEVFEKHKQLT